MKYFAPGFGSQFDFDFELPFDDSYWVSIHAPASPKLLFAEVRSPSHHSRAGGDPPVFNYDNRDRIDGQPRHGSPEVKLSGHQHGGPYEDIYSQGQDLSTDSGYGTMTAFSEDLGSYSSRNASYRLSGERTVYAQELQWPDSVGCQSRPRNSYRGRKGFLTQEQRAHARAVRKWGACDDCRRRKVRVGEVPLASYHALLHTCPDL